jgi:ring-1,2-phenylacetyl-CoA epoxidase subunit PaaC
MSLRTYILSLSDNAMILGHRLSELCGHGPTLETDIALTNVSLDFFGQVRAYLQYLAKLDGGEATEDTLAFLRSERDHHNCILVEQPNEDFAHVIMRQYLFDVFQLLQLEQQMQSIDESLAAIAAKAIKEARYHQRFSESWVLRLGDGTEVSHAKMQTALESLYPFVHELFTQQDWEKDLITQGIAVDVKSFESTYHTSVDQTLSAANLSKEGIINRYAQGKNGMHTEHLGYILNDLQYMQRAYPNMQW